MATEAILTTAINKAIDVGAQLIATEWSRLKGLSNNISWLEDQMKHMISYIQNAEAQQDNDPKVETLVQQVRDLAHDVELILDAISLENQDRASQSVMKSVVCILPYCLARRNFAKEIDDIRTRVSQIDSNRKQYGIEDNKDGVNEFNIDPRIEALHFDEPVVVGQDDDIQALKEKLLDREEQWPFAAIVGMAGLGKTTLAKRVFKSVKDEFDCSAMVTVSQKLNVKDVLTKIAKQIGEPEKKKAADLYSFLENKRYVILLDDIWHTTDWDRLRTSFPTSGNNGCRIIITSRDDSVGRYIGGDRCLHRLHPFNFETSWDLFNKLINPFLEGIGEEFKRFEMSHIGKKIIDRCGGVALAIVVAAGMLREREASEAAWNEVLRSIGQDSDDKCFPVLALSYNYLPYTLKPCFLYLALFPEDHEINVSQLVRMWVAEKFIQKREGLEMEDVGEEYVRKLVARNLVQVASRKYDGRIKRIRMHDLLHSLCVNMAKKINFFHVVLDDDPNHLTRVHRVSVQQQNVRRSIKLINEKNTKIHTLLHFDNDDKVTLKCSEKRFVNKSLHVMSISGEFVPGNFEKLSRLYYLSIWIGDVDISLRIPRFKGLQTLDLSGFILKVPTFVWKMKQLRHLLLRVYVDGNVGYNIIERFSLPKAISLPNLQTLQTVSASQVFTFMVPDSFPNLRKFGLINVANNQVKKLCGQKPISERLETLDISLQSEVNEKLDLSRYTNLVKLTIQNNWTIPPTPIRAMNEVKFPPNLVKLILKDKTLEQDPMQVLKSLPKLRILELHDCYTGKQLDCSGHDSFPQLQVLDISSLKNLEEIIGGEERGMHKLTHLTIFGCGKLQQMPEWFQQLCQERTS